MIKKLFYACLLSCFVVGECKAQPYSVPPTFYGQLYFSNLLNQFWGTFNGTFIGTNISPDHLSFWKPPTNGVDDATPACVAAQAYANAHNSLLIVDCANMAVQWHITNNLCLLGGYLGTGPVTTNATFVAFTNTDCPITIGMGEGTLNTNVASQIILSGISINAKTSLGVDAPAALRVTDGAWDDLFRDIKTTHGTNGIWVDTGTNIQMTLIYFDHCHVSTANSPVTNTSCVYATGTTLGAQGQYPGNPSFDQISFEDCEFQAGNNASVNNAWSITCSNIIIALCGYGIADGSFRSLGGNTANSKIGRLATYGSFRFDADGLTRPYIWTDQHTNCNPEYLIFGAHAGNGYQGFVGNVLQDDRGTNWTYTSMSLGPFYSTTSGTDFSVGQNNTRGGYLAGSNLRAGSNNVAIGYLALQAGDASSSVAIGSSALQSLGDIGTYNNAVGFDSLHHLTYGNQNVSMGTFSGNAAISSFGNVLIGNNTGSHDTNSQSSVAVGYLAMQSWTNYDHCIFIGPSADSTVVVTNSGFIGNGDGFTGVTQNNMIVVGNVNQSVTSGSNFIAGANVTITGVLSGYNGNNSLAEHGLLIPVASVHLTGLTTNSVGTNALVTVPASTTHYVIYASINYTTTGSSGSMEVAPTWIDPHSITRTTNPNLTVTDTTSYGQSGMYITCKASTTLGYTLTANTAAGGPVFDLDIEVMQF